MLETFKIFSEIGRLHLTELEVIGAKNQSEITDTLFSVSRVAIQSGLCDSIVYWQSLRVFETGFDKEQRESGKGDFWHPNGLFDSNYKPTAAYDNLVTGLSELL